ncbi:MAG TPA: hypothetical protein VFI28_09885, partial [Candidatus Limnocylindrales bacterium]|nr:hypothetical protein [Candidatus Limnocylindrales bacterium]
MSHVAGARVARITASAVVAAVALSVALVAPAFAATTATRFTDAVTSPPEDIVDDCTGLAGTVAGVGVVTGTVVETAQGFHLQTASNFVLTFEFVDGS